MVKASSSYTPPAGYALGNIKTLLSSPESRSIDCSRFSHPGHSATYISSLPDKTLYIDTPEMDLDDDGFTEPRADAPNDAWPAWKPHDWVPKWPHQNEVAYTVGPGVSWSAFLHPYVVLPGRIHLHDAKEPWWYRALNLGISKGDGAVIVKGNKWTACIFADVGPGDRIGEMSLAAHAMFVDGKSLFATESRVIDGHEVVVSVTRNYGSHGPWITLVFPGTATGSRDVTQLFSGVEAKFRRMTGCSHRTKVDL